MDTKEIKQLALELMEAACNCKVAEFEVETEEFKVHIKAPQCVASTVQTPMAVSSVSLTQMESESTEETLPQGTHLEAPLVGIFYSSATPEEPPFVEVGQKIKKGDTICIIEAMKTMNEIAAPCDGTINRIFVQNGEMVEYKQLICVIE